MRRPRGRRSIRWYVWVALRHFPTMCTPIYQRPPPVNIRSRPYRQDGRRHRKLPSRTARTHARLIYAGVMFWLRWNTLPGSYCRLTRASRS
jgi:hypothetical protein